jgi:uncharacterized protein (TIGR02145 family)
MVNEKIVIRMKAALLVAAAAGAVSAGAQVRAMACEPQVLAAEAAPGAGAVSYQWYYGATAAACTTAIAGCATQSCTIPAASAVGTVAYRRVATVPGYPPEVKETVAFTVSYEGVRVRATCWAPVNVGSAHQWVERPDGRGSFYQFNRKQAWDATSPSVGRWPAAAGSGSWGAANNPCPAGWSLPTRRQLQALDSASLVGNGGGGGFWSAASGATNRGNSVAGRYYGPLAVNTIGGATVCRMDGDMAGCVFLPASGLRLIDGSLLGQATDGHYWCREEHSAALGRSLYFNSASSIPTHSSSKAVGFSVRCVKTM